MRSRLAWRRALFGLALFAAIVVAVRQQARLARTYPYIDYLTGWALLGLMLSLTLYNVRKKLAFLPLLSSRLWLQCHVYLGWFTALVFCLHLQWQWPTGRFEGGLALLFAGVTVSGVLGWWLSRTVPPRLTTAGGEVPYERIPIVRRALCEQAEKLVLGVIPTAQAATLAGFYADRLAGFFAGPANFGAHLRGSHRPLNRLLAQLADLERFAGPEERKTIDVLAGLVRQKDALDFHRALQLLMKGWLFVHIPLTYALLVFSAAHVMLVSAFSGGAR